MRENEPRCPACRTRSFRRYHTRWDCTTCGARYPCTGGIPRLYAEARLAEADRRLRAGLYDNLMGRFYDFVWPFISLPVRPVAVSKAAWAAHLAIWAWLIGAAWHLAGWLDGRGAGGTDAVDLLVLLAFAASLVLLFRHGYVWKAVLLTPPTRIAVLRNPFHPKVGFAEAHARVLDACRGRPGLALLDVATGTCNSLYRHGWMDLDAEYTGVDLSTDMLLQGARAMTARGVPVDFTFADAHDLPYADAAFDIVTCYGAVNGMGDPGRALAEMARVLKPGGWLLILDEQLWDGASRFEELFFHHVLAAHDAFTGCPDHLMPKTLEAVEVHQVYQFYYVCTARRSGGAP